MFYMVEYLCHKVESGMKPTSSYVNICKILHDRSLQVCRCSPGKILGYMSLVKQEHSQGSHRAISHSHPHTFLPS